MSFWYYDRRNSTLLGLAATAVYEITMYLGLDYIKMKVEPIYRQFKKGVVGADR